MSPQTAMRQRLKQLPEEMSATQASSILKRAQHQAMRQQHSTFARFDAMRHSEDFHDWLLERRFALVEETTNVPRDIPAEFGIMGAMIADVPGAVKQGLAKLRPAHFTDARLIPVFRAVATLHHRQRREPEIQIWLLTVEIQLMLSGTWLEAGGKKMLKALWHYRCDPEEVSTMIEAVIEASKMRHLAQAAGHLSNVAAMDKDEPARLINAMRRALDQIEQRGACNMDALLKETK